jgi:predicted O-methyltransferase YrrM
VILVDNVLFHGSVIDPAAPMTAPRASGLQRPRHRRPAGRVMLAIGDGLTFIRRRG